MRTIGPLVLLFFGGLFVSDRMIEAWGRHWWIAPFRVGPVFVYVFYGLARVPQTRR